ncbi:MAG: hypothetical protein BWY02_01863 [bacterium ADurb.Bin157]|nr:MAG: hypothetical protein BWY02_01863 [bacterium ADurb.Bin157]
MPAAFIFSLGSCAEYTFKKVVDYVIGACYTFATSQDMEGNKCQVIISGPK